MTDWRKCENAARELLMMQSAAAFAVDVKGLDFGVSVWFETFRDYSAMTGIPLKILLPSPALRDGYTVNLGGRYIVLTGSGTGRRRNWTLAHEAGHIALKHEKDGETEEREANLFAAELLMPEPILFEIADRLGRVLNAREISSLFEVSASAAEYRVAQLCRKKTYSPYLRRELVEKYARLINCYLARRA